MRVWTVCLTTPNLFELATQDPRQVRSLVTHGRLVNGCKALEGFEGHVFRKVIDHSQNALVELARSGLSRRD